MTTSGSIFCTKTQKAQDIHLGILAALKEEKTEKGSNPENPPLAAVCFPGLRIHT